jgi:hypothetical protein
MNPLFLRYCPCYSVKAYGHALNATSNEGVTRSLRRYYQSEFLHLSESATNWW